MRQNHDFVTMDDYRHDMKETADHAAAVIMQLRERAEAAERVLAEVVLAAGGEVAVWAGNLHNPSRAVDLERWYCESDQTFVLKARSIT